MDIQSLSKKVAQYAPLLGAILPIPGGMAIGKAIADAFGCDVKDVDNLVRKIDTDPDTRIKLREIETKYSLDIEQLAVDRIKADNEDRASARNREIATKDKLPGRIATAFIIGYFILSFILMYAVITNTIEQTEQQMIVEMLKELSLAMMVILSYYFGASNSKNR